MLSNTYFLAKFRFDTAENEPAKNLQNFAKKIANFPNFADPNPLDRAPQQRLHDARRRGRGAPRRRARAGSRRARADLGGPPDSVI